MGQRDKSRFIILTRKGRLEQMELKIDPNGIW